VTDFAALPAALPFTVCTVLLCFNLMGVWGYSGGARLKAGVVPNPEDARTVSKGATVAPTNPEAVARVLRAHANADANVVPFLILALLFVLLGGSAKEAWIEFGIFTAARWAHTITYLAELQPWRTVAFALASSVAGLLAVRVLMLAPF
jgi:glutathione S-transferase